MGLSLVSPNSRAQDKDLGTRTLFGKKFQETPEEEKGKESRKGTKLTKGTKLMNRLPVWAAETRSMWGPWETCKHVSAARRKH